MKLPCMEFSPKRRYELKDLAFKRISEKYASCIETFESFQRDLVEFLKEDALRSQELSIANTFLVFDKSNLKSSKQKREKLMLLGYVSILADSLKLDSRLKVDFRNKNIHYGSLPALKIGRLCVDDKYRGHGIGECIISWVLKRVYYLNQNVACRFITLDAKRHQDKDKDSYNFYIKYKFQVLKTKKLRGHTAMYLDIASFTENPRAECK